MNAPCVAQAQMLSDMLAILVEAYRPESLALLGSAGGNGLDRIDPLATRRVVAVDINADYLAACSERHARGFASFEPIECDLSANRPFTNPVDLVYAALVLEYLEVDSFLGYAPSLVAPNGRIAFVFQNAGSAQSAVTNSGVVSLQALEAIHSPIPVGKVIETLSAQGMIVADQRSIPASSGKFFTLLVMNR
jgi:hypothetical protein